MNTAAQSADPGRFHQLYGRKKTMILYRKENFIDYVLMSALTALVIYLCYGASHIITQVGFVLLALMVIAFPRRHGFELQVPVILRRPQDVLYMIAHKVQNIRPVLLFAIAFLVLENVLIRLTPTWPHHTEVMHEVAMWAFYVHLVGISVYRTVVLIDHLRKKDLVRQILLETPWGGHVSKQKSIVIEIMHAYVTGLLTHVVLLAPWYVVISYSSFSAVFVPLVVIVNIVTYQWHLKTFNEWYYRDHWLGHHSELEFVYLHGPHHDALPSGLIGVSGNGYLEGFFRHTVGVPTPLYNPVISALLYSVEVWGDIVNHQYIPGVFPSNKNARQFHEMFQHSIHHMLRQEPYGIGLKDLGPPAPGEKRKVARIPAAIANSISLDEQLTGFQWDNPYHKRFLELFDKYQK